MPAIQPISSLPHSVSPAEHTEFISKTPENFSDIPPVLRHKQENVTVELIPAPQPSDSGLEGVMFGPAGLTTPRRDGLASVLAFILPSGKGFSVAYPRITLHAVSRSDSTGPHVYCQLDETPEGVEVPDDEDAEMSELKIIPGDMDAVEKIFEALSHCAALHPDPNGGNDGEGDFEGFEDDEAFIDADGELDEEELSEVGRAALAHLESIIQPRRVDPPLQGASAAGADPDHENDGESGAADNSDGKSKVNGVH
ncbi:hypothetical protein FS837_002850 [Tulasnella sp. UAMH 9824]|nr:hypothetical protein FS837_002850 [Tulasnella sp. UAMH 9824]